MTMQNLKSIRPRRIPKFYILICTFWICMKKYNPTSPARRQMEYIDASALTIKEPEKKLTSGFRRGSGRNSHGRITTRHKGGGVKRSFRAVDFIYDKIDVPAWVVSVEYDPNRSGFIALLQYRDGEKRYILASQALLRWKRRSRSGIGRSFRGFR